MSLTITHTAGSLGDWLSLTPLLTARPGTKVIALDSPHTRRFATLFEGLAEVEFVKGPIDNVGETNEPVCFSRRILNHYKVGSINSIPRITVSMDEMRWALNFLKLYTKPVVFANSVGGARPDKPETDIANYRKLPRALAQEVVTNLIKEGFTPIKFGVKETNPAAYEEFDGLVTIPDLTLRQVAACYAVIGRYVGADTGDHHLMLAVGGQCETLIPEDSWHYRHTSHLYLRDEDWDPEPARERYSIFTKTLPTP